MSVFTDIKSGLAMGDPEKKPFGGVEISRAALEGALEPMILSASGWRKVFAADGDEESRGEELTPADTLLAAAMAEAYADFLFTRVSKASPVVALGLDARFTGPAIAEVMIRVLLTRGISLRYMFIVAAPEIMGYTGQSEDCDGFIYISASHNPIGHNGVKFGLGGGVLPGPDAAELISLYRELLNDENALEQLKDRADGCPSDKVAGVYEESAAWKAKSFRVYTEFTGLVVSGIENPEERERFFDVLKQKIKENPLGVISELNGSARTLSIDADFLSSLGIKVKTVNGSPRQITHRIVPEGASLDLCRQSLEEEAAGDAAFQLGYVPDNDGDRGNLVYFSKSRGKALILEAQEVFALSVLSELAYLYWNEAMVDKTAVVINGPTSARIDDICEAFGCSAFRAEVGEANAVNLAQEKRDQGWQVRILGEGAAGGNITHPAAVRDPLNTLGALLKLLLLRSDGEKAGLFEIWCHLSGQTALYRPDFDLDDIIKSLPAYVTTSVYEPRAIMKISSMDQGRMKKRYEEIFLKDWEGKKAELFERFGISSWEEWNQEGTSSVCGMGPEYRSGDEKGGLNIWFKDAQGERLGYLWMRGSGTEPVFRVLVDWKGSDAEAESWLLDWHKDMIARADRS